jgi:hypothetical protein
MSFAYQSFSDPRAASLFLAEREEVRLLGDETLLVLTAPKAEMCANVPLRRDAGRAHRACDHRHGGFRYQSAHCMGTFASRGTHRIGNAVIAAANDRRRTVCR